MEVLNPIFPAEIISVPASSVCTCVICGYMHRFKVCVTYVWRTEDNLRVSAYHTACLKKGFLFSTAYSRVAGLKHLGILSFSSSTSSESAGIGMCAPAVGFMSSLGFEPRCSSLHGKEEPYPLSQPLSFNL